MSDIEKVKKLREATGAGFKDCNLAIKESGGDLDKAVEILRVKGISIASKICQEMQKMELWHLVEIKIRHQLLK